MKFEGEYYGSKESSFGLQRLRVTELLNHCKQQPHQAFGTEQVLQALRQEDFAQGNEVDRDD